MTSLSTKLYNLFHIWLSTEEEDYEECKEWLLSQFEYDSGSLSIGKENE